MTVTLYLDLFFLVNLAADFALLVLVKQAALPGGCRKGRLLAGAVLGAGSACGVILLPALSFLLRTVLWVFLPPVLMLRTAFGACGRAEFFRRLILLWMAALLCGGILLCSGVFLDDAGTERTGMASRAGHVPAAYVVPVFLLGCVFLSAAFRKFRRSAALRSALYEVTLSYQGRKKQVRALMDTGNQLYEPYGHQPVHVLDAETGKDFCGEPSGMIVVPFSSVGKEHGILMAVRMERMEVWQEGRLVCILERPWVAFSQTPLSPRHEYEMLLHGER